MALKNLLPTEEDWKHLQDLESTLVRRKTAANYAGTIAAITAALQVILTLADKTYFQSIVTFLSTGKFRLDPSDKRIAITLAIFFVSLVIYILLRRTQVLLRESTEAFRYTFWIDPFEEVKGTPGERFSLLYKDRFALLHHDLMERLDQRIHRFSILQEAPPEDGSATAVQRRRYSSHVHISGRYVLREGEDGRWFVHVMPIVRIGAATAPAMLAHPVYFPLQRSPESEETIGPVVGQLDVASYRDIVEHVYSSIATEVYRQLESDVRTKIELFPTAHLRSVALYYEADDFARSNTIDAYERAIALYREALHWYQLVTIDSLTRFFLWCPLLWRTEVRAQHEWARVVIGYAKCLIYRQRISAFTGRKRNALYELPELLGEAIEVLEMLQNKIGRRRANSKLQRLLAFLNYPRDAWFRRLFGISYSPVFKAQNDVLFEIYVVDCLARHYLDRHEDALHRLQDATATAPDRFSTDPLYLFARGRLEPDLEASILHLRAAVDADPDFQIARSSLADAYEQTFREEDEITAGRAKIVIDEYKAVLTLNYGNIQALSSLGFICWLTGDLQRARVFLEQGRQVKAIASQTYIGELSYRLARLAAENGKFEDCRNFYLEATAADPEVGAFDSTQQARSGLDVMGRNMLRRFEEYLKTVETEISQSKELSDETRRVVYSFALNDFGNACLRHFHFHGNRCWLTRAIKSYGRAAEVNPGNPLPWFNLRNAYGWSGDIEKMGEAYRRARQLAPSWTTVAIAGAMEQVRKSAQALETDTAAGAESEEKIRKATAESIRAKSEVEKAREAMAEAEALDARTMRRISVPVGQRVNQLHATALADQRRSEAAAEKLRQANETVSKLKQDIYDENRRREGRRRRRTTMEGEFAAAWTEALAEIRKTSRLAAVFGEEATAGEMIARLLEIDVLTLRPGPGAEHSALWGGKATLGEQVARLRRIPVNKLEAQDVIVMVYLADILRYSAKSDELQAAEMLACHLFDLLPEDYTVVSLLLDLLTRLPTTKTRQKLHERLERQHRAIINNWIETESRNFLALYWYAGFERNMPPDRTWIPDNLSALYFGDAPDLFENRKGWVLLWGYMLFQRETRFAAQQAFEKAIALRSNCAQYYFDLGYCLEWQRDFHGARVAYQHALDIDPDDRDYAAGLANAINQLGHAHWNSSQYVDAADLYAQAAKRLPTEPFFHSNLGRAKEASRSPDELQALKAGLPDFQKAAELAPESAEYRNEARRVRTRIEALQKYGMSNQSKYPLVVDPVTITYEPDLTRIIAAPDALQRYDELIHALAREYVPNFKLSIQIRHVRWTPAAWLAENTYRIGRLGAALVERRLGAELKYCMGKPDSLEAAGLTGAAGYDSLSETPGIWLESKDWAAADTNEFPLLDPLGFILEDLKWFLLTRLHQFLGHQDVVALLRESEPEIRAIADSFEQVSWLTMILKALLAERVPITRFDALCDMFLQHHSSQRPSVIIEKMRAHELIRDRLWGNSDDYVKIFLGPKMEALLEGGLNEADPWTVLALEPETCRKVVDTIHEAIADAFARNPGAGLALVTSKESVRVHARTLTAAEYPGVPVLAASELLKQPDTRQEIELA